MAGIEGGVGYRVYADAADFQRTLEFVGYVTGLAQGMRIG